MRTLLHYSLVLLLMDAGEYLYTIQVVYIILGSNIYLVLYFLTQAITNLRQVTLISEISRARSKQHNDVAGRGKENPLLSPILHAASVKHTFQRGAQGNRKWVGGGKISTRSRVLQIFLETFNEAGCHSCAFKMSEIVCFVLGKSLQEIPSTIRKQFLPTMF